MKEHPNVRAAFDKYHSKGFEIVSISGDRSEKALKDFLKKHESPWSYIYDEGGAIMQAHGVRGFPTMWLMDEKGRVVSTSARGDALHTLLNIMLNASDEAKKARLAKEAPKAAEKQAEGGKGDKADKKNETKEEDGKKEDGKSDDF